MANWYTHDMTINDVEKLDQNETIQSNHSSKVIEFGYIMISSKYKIQLYYVFEYYIKNNVWEFLLFTFYLFTVQNDQLLTTYDLGNGPTTLISPDSIVDGTLHDISIIISSVQMFNATAERKSNFLNWTCAVNIDDHEDSSVSSFNDNNVINRVITQRKKNYFKLFYGP